MKNLARIITAVVSGVLLCVTGSLGAAAAAPTPPGVNFNGEEAGSPNYWEFTDVAASGADINDLFGEVTKEMYPGSRKQVVVQLRNNAAAPVLFSLIARPLESGEAAALESRFAGKEALDALLDEINIAMTYTQPSGETGTIYDGPVRGRGEGVYAANGYPLSLAAVPAGRFATITVDLTVPLGLSNEFASKLCAVEWVFVAQQEDPAPTPTVPPSIPPVTPPGGGSFVPTDPGAPAPPPTAQEAPPPPPAAPDEEQLLDEEVALGNAVVDDGALEDAPEDEADIVLVAGEVPLGLPQTGRLVTFAAPIAVFLGVTIALFALTYVKRGKNEETRG